MITHISHTLAQQIVNTIKDVCSYDINFINSSGTIIASTNSARIGAFHEIGRKAAVTGTTIEVAESDNFTGTRQGINMPLYHEDRLLAVIGITGSPEKVRKYAFLAQRITSLLIREQELGQYSRHQADKKQFVISSLLHGDTQNPEYLLKCLKEFQIDPDTPKRLILIHTYPAASGQNYTDSVSGSVLSEHQIQNFFKTAGITLYTFRYPGDGRSVSLYQLGLSLTTAETALRSLSFHQPSTDNICAENYAVFDDLTLEIVLSSVSPEDREEFSGKTIRQLSSDEKELLRTYFSLEMSLADTAEKLFLHKNTLQYKLNHIYKKCGLNPRKFRDAVLLYLALEME